MKIGDLVWCRENFRESIPKFLAIVVGNDKPNTGYFLVYVCSSGSIHKYYSFELKKVHRST
jgi:hypothetical protein